MGLFLGGEKEKENNTTNMHHEYYYWRSMLLRHAKVHITNKWVPPLPFRKSQNYLLK
jgi:hypothetical protein